MVKYEGTPGEEAEVVGIITTVNRGANARWMSGKMETKEGEISFAGACAGAVGDKLRVRGVWEHRGKFGIQLAVHEMVLDLPVDQAAVATFLARSENFPGVGPARAQAIAEAAGEDFEAALRDPVGLAERAGVPIAIVSDMAQRWAESRDSNVIASHLARYGVTSPAAVKRLVDLYGSNIVHVIETNPYQLIGKAPRLGFRTVDKIALAAGVAKNSPGRIGAALVYVLRESEGDGHTWLARSDLLEMTKVALNLDTMEDYDLVDQAAEKLIFDGSLVACEVPGTEESAIFRAAMYRQDWFAFDVANRAGNETDLNGAWANEAYAKTVQPSLYPMQAHACAVAWGSRLSVITGGAGVGKTFIVQAIYEGATQQGLDVRLCATTGKAAKRMGEAVGTLATTIHGLLVCKPPETDEEGGSPRFEFVHTADNQLDCDMIIVDEVSMLAADLAYDLFSAIDFARTQVVLVGDHNQLPPVGAGALLRDLVTHKPIPVVELNEVVRQAGPLKVAVKEILDGRVHHEIREPGNKGLLAGPWALRMGFEKPEEIEQEVARLFKELPKMHIEDRFADGGSRPIDPVRDVLFLTPQRETTAGVLPLNAIIQTLACERDGRPVPKPHANSKRGYAIGLGDRVMWTRNDKKLELMNGTLGDVLAVLSEGEEFDVPISLNAGIPLFAIDGKYKIKYQQRRNEDGSVDRTPIAWTYVAKGRDYVVLWQEPAGEIAKAIPARIASSKMELAYAMTVHKAQGSEAPVIVCVCSSNHHRTLSRNLLYTGVSRARKACFLVGSMKAARQAAHRTEDYRRRTLFNLVYRKCADMIGAGAPPLVLGDDTWNY